MTCVSECCMATIWHVATYAPRNSEKGIAAATCTEKLRKGSHGDLCTEKLRKGSVGCILLQARVCRHHHTEWLKNLKAFFICVASNSRPPQLHTACFRIRKDDVAGWDPSYVTLCHFHDEAIRLDNLCKVNRARSFHVSHLLTTISPSPVFRFFFR